jgi:hypothetical protein
MATQGMYPSGADTFRPDPRSGIPKQRQASFRLWLVAVAAGLFETVLVVVDAIDGEVGSAAQVAVGVAVRLLVFAGAVYLAVQLRHGKHWARVALAVLLGGIGTLSLVIGPATWLAEGGSLADAVAAAELGSVLFAASRAVHLGAVIAAVILMFHPAANAYVQAATGLGPGRGSTATAGPPADRLLGVPSGYRQARTPSPDAAGRSSAPPAGSATTRMEELGCPD